MAGRGLTAVLRATDAAYEGLGRGALEGVKAAAHLIAQDALARTPIQTGALRRSLVESDNGDARNRPEAAVGYTAEYAGWVHEGMHVQHKVGEAKFLQRAVNAKGREAIDEIQKATGTRRR